MTAPEATEPEFGDLPPATSKGRADWEPTADKLRANPKQWAKITTRGSKHAAASFAHQCRQGIRSAFRPVGAFEFAVRDEDVWARFVGQQS